MTTRPSFEPERLRSVLHDESSPLVERIVALGALRMMRALDEPPHPLLGTTGPGAERASFSDLPSNLDTIEALLEPEFDAADAAALAMVAALAGDEVSGRTPPPDLLEVVEAGILSRMRLACLAHGVSEVVAALDSEHRSHVWRHAADAVRLAEGRFDECVGPLEFRLVLVNGLRDSLVRQFGGSGRVPQLVARGRGIAVETLAYVDEVAEWAESYSEAAAELERLRVLAHRLRAREGAPTDRGNVRTLRERLRTLVAGGDLRLAAARQAPRVTLVQTADYVVAYEEPGRLLVDFLREDPIAPPFLELSGATEIPARTVAGTLGRFDFRLGAEVLDAVDAVLVLPLLGGSLRLPLVVP